MDKEKIFKECRNKCTCNHRNKTQHNAEVKKHFDKLQNDEELFDFEQKTFVTFATDIVSIIAFIFFGSVIFWLAIARILLDCLKKLCQCDRCTKMIVLGLFTMLFLSMTTRLVLNQRAWKVQQTQEETKLEQKNTTINTPSEAPILPQTDFLKIGLLDKRLEKLANRNKTDRNISKKFTVSIVDEKKKEVFKISKDFELPQMALEMKRPPALIVYLKDIILENY